MTMVNLGPSILGGAFTTAAATVFLLVWNVYEVHSISCQVGIDVCGDTDPAFGLRLRTPFCQMLKIINHLWLKHLTLLKITWRSA